MVFGGRWDDKNVICGFRNLEQRLTSVVNSFLLVASFPAESFNLSLCSQNDFFCSASNNS